MTKRKLNEVFKTVGLPPYTYVKPPYYGEIRADVEQPGKHLLIEGPSGVGKTCVIYKVLEEQGWKINQDYQYVSCRDANAEKMVEEFLSQSESPRNVGIKLFIVDDFHLFSNEIRARVGSRLKRISDFVFETGEPRKFVLIGIPTAGVSLLSEARDLGPRIGIYRLKSASSSEISRLIDEGEQALQIIFEDREIIQKEIEGNFWLAQYICNKICATKEIFETQDKIEVVSCDILSIRRRLMEELVAKYEGLAVTFCKGKKWRPSGNKPYLEVFGALMRIKDSVISFDQILSVIPESRRSGVKAIRQRIPEVIYSPEQQVDLRKHIFFSDSARFSIEDPLFRYYLSNLDLESLYRILGTDQHAVERSSKYAYDIGFSFAGETRMLVEAVNRELKEEDVDTFYDYDKQAFLLAQDLEETLQRVYSSACRFYLVFLDRNYVQKVWTRFERDVLTRPGRKSHIIPVIADAELRSGVLGISASIGRIDLVDVWARISRNGEVTAQDLEIVRNRCVVPLLEKLEYFDEGNE